MPWFAISDAAHNHPKIIAAKNAAFGLWVRCGSYAAQHLTDGIVPKGVPKSFDGTANQIAKLVEAGLWHAHGHGCPKCAQPEPGEFIMHDYLDYNPSKEVVEERRAREAAKKRRQRSGDDPQGKRTRFEAENDAFPARFEPDSENKNTPDFDESAGQGDVSPGDSPGPRARAFPSPPLPSPRGGAGRERTAGGSAREHGPPLSQIPADWQPSEKDLGAARADVDRLGPEAVAEATRKFIRHHTAKGTAAADFGPWWVTWLSRERSEPPHQGALLLPLPGGGTAQPGRMTRGQQAREGLARLLEQKTGEV